MLGIFGGSRAGKRAQRDKYMGKLYSMGMSRSITMNHSDHWEVAKLLYDLTSLHGQNVIDAINEIVPKTGGKLWSRNDSEYGQVDQIIRRAEELTRKQEEERKAKAEKERKEREEAEKKAREEAEKENTGNGSGGTHSGQAEDMMSNPYVLGGAVLGAGTLLILLFGGKS